MIGLRTDEDIKRDVVESLYWDTRVDAGDVGVLVDDGEVTLVGSVPTFRARRAAREDAAVIQGVVDVVNRLEIEISPQLDTPDDEELYQTLEEVLAADPDLGASDIEVDVESGKMRLHGSVQTFWEKQLAYAVASTLPGVRGLTNEIAVVPSRDHDDEEIATDVIAALRRNRHVDVTDLDVEVIEGCVILAGRVPDEATRQEVLDAARYTAGVTDVRDQLHVAGTEID